MTQLVPPVTLAALSLRATREPIRGACPRRLLPSTRSERLDALGRDDREFGKQLGGKGRRTLAWRLHPNYTQRLAASDLRHFDWTKARRLRGVARAL